MSTPISRRTILLSITAALAFADGAVAGLFTSALPDDLDLSMAKLTNAGLYRATLSPDAMPITVRKMHVWTVTLLTAAGAPVTHADIVVSGGMPQHGHGLPTTPQVTKNLGNGRYQIEGVKFNMRGWWTFDLTVNGEAGADVVTFNFDL